MRILHPIGLALSVCFLLFATHFSAYRHGHNVGDMEAREELNQALTIQRERAEAAEQQTRDLEAKHRTDMAAADQRLTEALNDERAKSEAAVAAVRAGTVRVRDRFTCPATGSGQLSNPGTGTGPGDGAAAHGLQSTDVEFLLRLAGEADEVAQRLKACQAIVRADRAAASGAAQHDAP